MRTDINAEAEKDPDELEHEVDELRAHIGDTLSALENRFSPGQILDQVFSYTKSNGGDFSRNLVNTIKANPIPTLLTATGLTWMMYGQNRSPSSSFGSDNMDDTPSYASYGVDPDYETGFHGTDTSSTSSAKDKAKRLSEGGKDSVKNAQQRMSGSAHQASQRTRHQLHNAQDRMRQQAGKASDGFEQLLHDQPLALGAIGIALGALIGASVPQSRKEQESLGKPAQKVADKTAQAAEGSSQQLADTGRKMSEEAKRAASQSSQHH